MILSLLITMIIVNAMFPLLINIREMMKRDRYFYQDEMGVYQLQIKLALNEITDIASDCIYYSTIESECRVHIVNGKLISQPGTVDYIHGIDEVVFTVEEGIIYMSYNRGSREYRWPIGVFYEK